MNWFYSVLGQLGEPPLRTTRALARVAAELRRGGARTGPRRRCSLISRTATAAIAPAARRQTTRRRTCPASGARSAAAPVVHHPNNCHACALDSFSPLTTATATTHAMAPLAGASRPCSFARGPGLYHKNAKVLCRLSLRRRTIVPARAAPAALHQGSS